MLTNITDRVRLLFRTDKEPYLCFYKILGFYPHDIRLYEQALLHKSSSVKEKGRLLNNERLEFLGDAILDAIVADIVYKRFEGKREGFLTNTRSKIVQRETLNNVAVQIGLDKLIKFTTKQSSHNSYVSGNAFEALIGAIYLDRGYRLTKHFLEHRIFAQYINLDKISRKEVNFKSKLIEWSQKNKFEISFELVNQGADEHQNPTFETCVMVEKIAAGTGKGYSKKESQQEAAHETLAKIKNDPVFIDAIFAAKAEREGVNDLREPLQPEQKPALHEELAEELPERYHDYEHIVAQAEAAAFEAESKRKEDEFEF